MKELFKSITGYEGLYEVSNLGNVRRIAGKGCIETRVLKLIKQLNGYLYVGLCKNNKVKLHRVHRLVATAFIDNPENLPCINHIDENKENNRVDNLEWCSYSYNLNYGTHNERMAKALSKKVLQLTLDGVLVREWESVNECHRNGFDKGHVSDCCNNKYGRQGNVYKGYRWVYAEDYEQAA